MVNFTYSQFCSDPVRYKDQFIDQKMYNNLVTDCKTRLNDIRFPTADIGEFMQNFLNSLTMMLTSPEFYIQIGIFEAGAPLLKMMAEITDIVLPWVMKRIGTVGFTYIADILARVMLFSVQTATRAFMNAVIIGIGSAVRMVISLSFKAAALVLEGISLLFQGTIGSILMFFMLLDMVDICNYTPPPITDANEFRKLQDRWNTYYSSIILRKVKSPDTSTDIYGNEVFLRQWPLEVDGSQFINITQEERNDSSLATYYNNLYLKYINQYTQSLAVNSIGEPIIWSDTPIKPLSEPTKRAMWKALDSFVGNRNTVAINWLHKYWWVVAILILTIVTILVVYK
jgi:hypothetical protein